MGRPRRPGPRPVRDCICSKTRHQHGTALAYIIDRCRCHPCTTANSDYVRNRKRQVLYGRWDPGFVDAQPLREHLAGLQAAGMGAHTIAKRSGVSKGAINRLIWGYPADGIAPSKRVKATTAAALLAVKPTVDNLAPGAFIDGTGTRRRLRALSAMGWSTIRLSAELGCTHNNVSYLLTSSRKVTKGTADEISALYDRLWSAPPKPRSNFEVAGIRQTRRNALAKGWAPPLAWDDDTIDDPQATPDLGAKPHNTGGRPHALHVEDIDWLLEDEPLATAQRLAERLRVTKDAVHKTCHRAGRTDLLERLARNADLRGAAA